jgi:hypothetical protein
VSRCTVLGGPRRCVERRASSVVALVPSLRCARMLDVASRGHCRVRGCRTPYRADIAVCEDVGCNAYNVSTGNGSRRRMIQREETETAQRDVQRGEKQQEGSPVTPQGDVETR